MARGMEEAKALHQREESMRVRPAVFAGSWYPRREKECRREVERFFQQAPPVPEGAGEPLGGIVPHAGWVYSGGIAGKVVALMKKGLLPDTVVLFGGHLGTWSQHLIMAEGAWETPLGPIEVDSEMASRLLQQFHFSREEPDAADPDNTRELQLPLIKYAFPQARILPIGTAPTEEGIRIGESVARIAAGLGRKIRVLGSTDLTHYGPGYGFTPHGSGEEAERWVRGTSDRSIIERMKEMEPQGVLQEALERGNACCPGAVAAALSCLRGLGACRAQEIAYATSWDVHPGDDFVGYVGIVYWA